MEIRPILSAMRRHKTLAALIVLEIAFSCAILCNAVFLIHTRLKLMDRPTGLMESELVHIQQTEDDSKDNAEALTEEDEAALRAIPGVKAAAATNAFPLSGSGRSLDVRLAPDEAPMLETAYYLGDEHLIDAMGLNLIAGRRFASSELLEWKVLSAPNSTATVSLVIITRSMAEKLFPGQNALGKSFYAWDDSPMTVIGIVDQLVQSHGFNDPDSYGYSILLPVKGAFPNYLLRVGDPMRRAEVLKLAAYALERIEPDRALIVQETVEEMRTRYYQKDREMAWLLVVVCLALLVVTALGIVGLASFWVQQRTRQIGVRRALGATRRQILRHFQIENLLLATIGIVLGMLMAYGINQVLMGEYELPRLPLVYLPIGAAMLWVLGQIAVLGPARRAAAVSPAVATRST